MYSTPLEGSSVRLAEVSAGHKSVKELAVNLQEIDNTKLEFSDQELESVLSLFNSQLKSKALILMGQNQERLSSRRWSN